MSFDEFEGALDGQMEVRTATYVQILTLLGQELERGGWEKDGATSMSGWLCGRYGMNIATASELVRIAGALRELQAISTAADEGLLSYDQLRPLTFFATPETDRAWARAAQGMSAGRLWREKFRQEQIQRRDAQIDHAMRRVWMSWDEGRRFLELSGSLPAEQGAAVEHVLRERASEVARDGTAIDPEGARLADALTDLVTREAGGSPKPVLVVHADAEVVAGAPAAGRMRMAETESGIRLAEDEVRRIACDANVEWVLESEGRPVGVGRRTRAIPGHVARILRHRDQGCRFPGCANERWLRAHHIRHWADGGPTDVDNLLLLCHAHHRLLHEGGWSLSGRPSIELEFRDARGQLRPETRSPSRAREPAGIP